MDPAQNYMVLDVVHGLIAFLIFPLFTVVPGYMAASWFDLLGFRKLRAADQAAIAIALSIGCYPVMLYLAGHFGGPAGMWWLAVAVWLAAAATLVLRPPQLLPLLRWLLPAIAVAAFLVISQADLQWGHILVGSQTEIDYAKHIAVTDALFRTGADADNPFFHPGRAVGLFYYGFWHLLCAMVERVAPWVTARGAVLGGLPWGAAGLAATIRLYLLLLWRVTGKRETRIAFLLLLVSGLDIVPVVISDAAYLLAHRGVFYFHLEWWNAEQITSWLGTMLWVPQHLAALTANLTGVLLLHWSAETGRQRAAAVVLSGLCIASGLGASIWVTMACLSGMGVWAAFCIWKSRRLEASMFTAAVATAAAAALPFLLRLRSVAQVKLTPVAFYVRPFGPARGGPLVSLLALPLNYALEFGIYGLVAVFWLRDARRRAWNLEVHEQLAAAFTGASLLLISFVRSTMGSNDLAMRGALPAQFFLLLLAVQWLQRPPAAPNLSQLRPWAAQAVSLCLLLGFLTTAYDWAGTRFHHLAVVSDGQDQPAFRYQLRAAYEFVKAHTPRTAIVQHNPDRQLAIPYGVYGERQVVAADWFHGPLFAISPAAYAATAHDVARMFAAGATAAVVHEVADKYGIAAIVVDESDPAWTDRQSWVSTTPPDFALSKVRVYLLPPR